ncbi:hypothetical protein DE146DRAFT_641968 [Phaeosphaeria sp. MPI-PUGE-AT-0046c]|nr:hypothetical protein DE146DRAFT_641968 [Phaeosphaeria sp. MPI-PUGE-AT-0046c]
MSDSLRVTLRDLDGFGGLLTRQFDLAVGSQLPVGRASKNSNKKELMPAADNGYIDSPVISREHAQLSARGDSNPPRVFVTDLGSMHGTMVNGEQLVAHAPMPLSSGDTLQFGIDVNRNEEFFVARKYRFDVHHVPPQAPFSLGFTVPDSEEEDVGGTTSRRGSENNPLTIDDSDYPESNASDDEHGGTPMVGEGFIVDDDDAEPPAMVDIHLQSATDSWSREFLNDGAEELVPGDSLQDAGESSDSQGEDPESDMDSAASNIGDESDIDDDSDDQELPETEMDMTSNTMNSQLAPSSVPSSEEMFQMEGDHRVRYYEGQLPALNLFSNPSDASVLTSANPPPLPPRPSVPQPSLFSHTELPPTSRSAWYPEDVPVWPSFSGTNHSDRPVLFSPAPPFRAPAQDANITAAMYGGSSSAFAPAAGQLQTSTTFSNSDAFASSTPLPPPSRMLSIEEMVEDQPPTPTSLNGLKRKADVLEVTEDAVAENHMDASSQVTPPADSPFVNEPVVNSDVAQIAAIIAQRPKKQPRSLIKTGAKYLGIGLAGAAGTVALLSSLPDAFFV